MTPLPESESSKSEQSATVSTEGDGSSTTTSAQPRQTVSCHHHESGSLDKNSPENPSSNSHVIQVESAGGNSDPAASSSQVPQRYCRQASAEDRKRYLGLYEKAKDGKWEAAKTILESSQSKDRNNLLRADLTNRKETILHVATQANQAGFVRRLLNYLDVHEIKDCLESEDVNKNTAFLFAVASGNMEIVDMMAKKDPDLLKKKDLHERVIPLHVAALQGKIEMTQYLYKKTISMEFEYDLKLLFFLCVHAGIYDLALELLKKEQDLAFKTDDKGETVLQILSRKPLGLKQTQQHELVRYLWNNIFLGLSDNEIIEKIRRSPHVVFNAAEVGNFRFLELLINTYPYLVWEVDESDRSIIHIAVLHRQADIFNFTRGIGSIKDIIVHYKASDGSNLLHMAASLPSKDRLNLVSGAAFQMTLELLWFEEVKKMVPPSFIEEKEENGLTPRDLFTKKHEGLLKEAQSWMEKTTNCCMVVSTLITTGVFTATFSIPGGVEDNSGSPHYLLGQTTWFMIFSIFDAIAMISSSTSIFIFFSILISRREEYDFHYRSLPTKLIFGLITLLISIISMMMSFSNSFIMYFNTKAQRQVPHHNVLKWVPISIFVLSFMPIPIFVYLLWPLWSDIGKLINFSRHLSRPRKNMFHLKKCGH